MKDKLNKILGRSKNNNLMSIISPRKNLSLEFLKQGLKGGKNCVFVSNNTDLKSVENEVKKILTNDDMDSRIRFIDFSSKKPSFNVYRSNLSNLSHLNVVLAQSLADLMSPESRICIFDCLSDIKRNNKPEDVSKFIKILTDIVEKYDTTALLFSDEESKELKNLTDRVLIE